MLSRTEILTRLQEISVDEFSEEDASLVLDVLLEGYTLLQAWTWLCFYNKNLFGVPIVLIEEGKTRAVVLQARADVGKVSS